MAPLDLSSVTLQYFPIQGRGEPIRLLLADAGIAFSESNDTASFFANKHDLAQYRFQQLPRLSVTARAGSDSGGSGEVHLVQQGAILRFLAKVAQYGEGATPWQEALVDQLQDACEDLNSAYTRCIYGQDAPSLLAEFMKTTAPKVLNQCEYLFKTNKGEAGYLVYDQPSFAEFHLLYLVHALRKLVPSILDAYPKLAAWDKTMRERPGLRNYEQSHEMLNGNANGQEPLAL
ncbi:hypothetical protein JCM9279_006188 [Rhodotorula babjevae]